MINKFQLIEQNQELTVLHLQAVGWRTICNVDNKATSTTKGENRVDAGLHPQWKEVRQLVEAVRKVDEEGKALPTSG